VENLKYFATKTGRNDVFYDTKLLILEVLVDVSEEETIVFRVCRYNPPREECIDTGEIIKVSPFLCVKVTFYIYRIMT
jgi:hypothetical protein